VISATIVDGPFQSVVGRRDYTDGYLKSMKVELKNNSPYTLRVTTLSFTSCGPTGIAELADPIVLDPKGTKQASITIDRHELPDAWLASCQDTGGWNRQVFVEYTP
jgi:hypothetical protein